MSDEECGMVGRPAASEASKASPVKDVLSGIDAPMFRDFGSLGASPGLGDAWFDSHPEYSPGHPGQPLSGETDTPPAKAQPPAPASPTPPELTAAVGNLRLRPRQPQHADQAQHAVPDPVPVPEPVPEVDQTQEDGVDLDPADPAPHAAAPKEAKAPAHHLPKAPGKVKLTDRMAARQAELADRRKKMYQEQKAAEEERAKATAAKTKRRSIQELRASIDRLSRPKGAPTPVRVDPKAFTGPKFPVAKGPAPKFPTAPRPKSEARAAATGKEAGGSGMAVKARAASPMGTRGRMLTRPKDGPANSLSRSRSNSNAALNKRDVTPPPAQHRPFKAQPAPASTHKPDLSGIPRRPPGETSAKKAKVPSVFRRSGSLGKGPFKATAGGPKHHMSLRPRSHSRDAEDAADQPGPSTALAKEGPKDGAKDAKPRRSVFAKGGLAAGPLGPHNPRPNLLPRTVAPKPQPHLPHHPDQNTHDQLLYNP